MTRSRARRLPVLCAVVLMLAGTSATPARATKLFQIRALSGVVEQAGGNDDLLPLIRDFVEADDRAGFGALAGLFGYTGTLDYAGAPDAILFDVSNFARDLTVEIPSTGTIVNFQGTGPDDLADQLEAWVKSSCVDQWSDFLRQMNGQTPFAVISGNPKSTVALLGDSAYRKFGFDDSRSRMGFGEEIGRWGDVELRIDAGYSSVATDEFESDFWTFDPA